MAHQYTKQKINGAILEMSDLNTQIAQASKQQSKVSGNNNANNITQYAQLANIARSLHEELHKFKV